MLPGVRINSIPEAIRIISGGPYRMGFGSLNGRHDGFPFGLGGGACAYFCRRAYRRAIVG